MVKALLFVHLLYTCVLLQESRVDIEFMGGLLFKNKILEKTIHWRGFVPFLSPSVSFADEKQELVGGSGEYSSANIATGLSVKHSRVVLLLGLFLLRCFFLRCILVVSESDLVGLLMTCLFSKPSKSLA